MTDSDDDESISTEEFFNMYEKSLNVELKDTTLDESFEKMEIEDGSVDVNKNLITNINKSYESQQGLPGPSSNLAGLLNVNLNKNKSSTSNI